MLMAAPVQPAVPSCPVSYVHYRSGDHRLGDLPWLRGQPDGSGLVLALAYWPEAWRRERRRGALIYTGTEMPQGSSTKALWAFLRPTQRNRGSGMVTMRGRRLDAPGHFTQRFYEISYEGQNGAPSYASTIDVPKPGCWRLTATTAKLRGSVVLRALPAPQRG
jgi:hypothetical protein